MAEEKQNRSALIVSIIAISVSISFSALTAYFQFFKVPRENLIVKVDDLTIKHDGNQLLVISRMAIINSGDVPLYVSFVHFGINATAQNGDILWADVPLSEPLVLPPSGIHPVNLINTAVGRFSLKGEQVDQIPSFRTHRFSGVLYVTSTSGVSGVESRFTLDIPKFSRMKCVAPVQCESIYEIVHPVTEWTSRWDDERCTAVQVANGWDTDCTEQPAGE